MFHVFLMEFAKQALRGTSETPSDQIIPSENVSVKDHQEEGSDLWPSFDIPYLAPIEI